MRGRVIQGFFVGGQMRAAPGVLRSAANPIQRAATPGAVHRAPGPPPRMHIAPPGAVQARMAPGRPALAHQPARPAQLHGGSESFDVDPAQLGLARGGGSPLPQAVLAKMEAAFEADFSQVRVHVGPQASRIGAVAFTTGNDIYFAPGRYVPDSTQGQQLLGHELAHVIQQRKGRVRTSGNGVSVVQDFALEAEADRLGMRAAAFRSPVQRKVATGSQVRGAVQRQTTGPAVPGSVYRPSQRGANPAATHAASIQRKVEVKWDGVKGAYQIYGRPEFNTALKKAVFEGADDDGESYIVNFSDNSGVSFAFPTVHRRHKLAWSLWRAGVNEVLEYGDEKDMTSLMSKCFVPNMWKSWSKKEFKAAWDDGKYLENMANDFFNHSDNVWLGPGDENIGKGGGLDKLIVNYIKNPNKVNRKKLREAAYDPHDKSGFKFQLPTAKTYGGWQYTSGPPSPRSNQMDTATSHILDYLGK